MKPEACHSCGRTDEPLDPFSKRCVDCLIAAAKALKAGRASGEV